MATEYVQQWDTDLYRSIKREIFLEVSNYLPQPPQRILDIGAGYAHVSELMQQTYGSELWFIEGQNSLNPESAVRSASYGTRESMQYYTDFDQLEQYWQSRGIRYTLLDADRLDLDPSVKFDLIYSWISCGYHYPARTYRDFILAHSTDATVIIMDVRRKSLSGDQKGDFEIIHTFTDNPGAKKQRIQLKFL